MEDLYEDTQDELGFDRSPRGSIRSGGSTAAQAAAQGGSGTDVATAGLVGSGNPYAMAAGLGLAVLSAKDKAKRKREEQEAMMKVDRISRQTAAINNLMGMSQKLGL